MIKTLNDKMDFSANEYEDNNLMDPNEIAEQELAYEKEKKICFVLDQINILYKKIIGEFHGGEKIIFNPNIFTGLTKKRFTNWIISNNPELNELFS
jgi:hypothetical protein